MVHTNKPEDHTMLKLRYQLELLKREAQIQDKRQLEKVRQRLIAAKAANQI